MLTTSLERGFSLLEVVVATGVVTGAFAALAQMFAFSAAGHAAARTGSAAVVLAVQKMEQLRGLSWGFDANGHPVADTSTDTASADGASSGGTGLTPGGGLQENVAGYVDYVDETGRTLGGGDMPLPGTRFVRRWSIEPSPANADTLIFQVMVTGSNGKAVRLVTLRARSVP